MLFFSSIFRAFPEIVNINNFRALKCTIRFVIIIRVNSRYHSWLFPDPGAPDSSVIRPSWTPPFKSSSIALQNVAMHSRFSSWHEQKTSDSWHETIIFAYFHVCEIVQYVHLRRRGKNIVVGNYCFNKRIWIRLSYEKPFKRHWILRFEHLL